MTQLEIRINIIYRNLKLFKSVKRKLRKGVCVHAEFDFRVLVVLPLFTWLTQRECLLNKCVAYNVFNVLI